jgi:CMP-N-acetylneuraminic acid synthetase
MIHNRKVTALLPIKEHSERVKNKNFRLFNGKPLYHHILETLDNTYAIDEIIIDTDSYVVINEAQKIFNKVTIHERPKELRGDFVSVNKIIEYDISKSDSNIFVQTHATNPLLKAETLAIALKKFIESEDNNDSLFSVNRYQSRFYTHKGEAINHIPDELLRTQDLPPVYEENSNFYIFTKESFHKKKRRIGENPILFEMSRIEAIDIDDEFSFKLAEILALYAGDHINIK